MHDERGAITAVLANRSWTFLALIVIGVIRRARRFSAALVNLSVPLQIALVTCSVIAEGADEVLLSAVHGQMALQQRFTAKVSAAVATHVSAAVEYEHVISQRRFVAE